MITPIPNVGAMDGTTAGRLEFTGVTTAINTCCCARKVSPRPLDSATAERTNFKFEMPSLEAANLVRQTAIKKKNSRHNKNEP